MNILCNALRFLGALALLHITHASPHGTHGTHDTHDTHGSAPAHSIKESAVQHVGILGGAVGGALASFGVQRALAPVPHLHKLARGGIGAGAALIAFEAIEHSASAAIAAARQHHARKSNATLQAEHIRHKQLPLHDRYGAWKQAHNSTVIDRRIKDSLAEHAPLVAGALTSGALAMGISGLAASTAGPALLVAAGAGGAMVGAIGFQATKRVADKFVKTVKARRKRRRLGLPKAKKAPIGDRLQKWKAKHPRKVIAGRMKHVVRNYAGIVIGAAASGAVGSIAAAALATAGPVVAAIGATIPSVLAFEAFQKGVDKSLVKLHEARHHHHNTTHTEDSASSEESGGGLASVINVPPQGCCPGCQGGACAVRVGSRRSVHDHDHGSHEGHDHGSHEGHDHSKHHHHGTRGATTPIDLEHGVGLPLPRTSRSSSPSLHEHHHGGVAAAKSTAATKASLFSPRAALAAIRARLPKF